jgi:hypothetical protein
MRHPGDNAGPTGAEDARLADVAADPAGDGTLGSRARYGRHIDGHCGWESGRPGPNQTTQQRPVRSSG